MCLAAAVLASVVTVSSAQSPGGALHVASPLAPMGPPAPVAPEVIARDGSGGVTVRASRVEGLKLDGHLDEPVYSSVKSFSGLIQNQPDAGKASSQKTDIWVFFDDDNFYVSARCWDAGGAKALVANEMRRDNNQISSNDNFGIVIDTFFDHHNGYIFFVNPLGAMRDLQLTNEGNSNQDWNPVWNIRTDIFDQGWTVEMKIPFKSIRYRPGAEQVWGFNVRRSIRKRNEFAYLTALPPTEGSGAWLRVSRAATLVGLEAPTNNRNLDIKPYAIGGVRSDRTANPVVSKKGEADAGVDVKYGLTKGLTLDLSYNTDFAQVEVDEQQVNLTRFNLFFPEKREFFLEGRGIFEFARPNFLRGSVPVGGIVPDLFFSRQIGLNRGRVIPIMAGGRLTGRVGKTTIGMLNMETDAEETSRTKRTNFSVFRVRRDLLRRSIVGAMYTGRSESIRAPGHANHAIGVDGAFSFFDNVNLNGYVARSVTSGAAASQLSYQTRLDYNADKYGLELDHLFVGKDYNPEVGFVQRPDIRRTVVSPRFSPRPRKRVKSVRQFTWDSTLEFIQNNAGDLVTRDLAATFNTEFQRSDRTNVTLHRIHDRLDAPFRLVGGPTIKPGAYDFQNVTALYGFGSHRKISGSVSALVGTYYDGTQRAVTISGGRVQVTPQFSLEPSASINWFDFDYGSLTARVVRTRVNYTFSPRMYVSGIVQYNSSTKSVSTNFRWRWEYIPGSELFVVYTDENNTQLVPGRASTFLNRALAVKVNRLLRF